MRHSARRPAAIPSLQIMIAACGLPILIAASGVPILLAAWGPASAWDRACTDLAGRDQPDSAALHAQIASLWFAEGTITGRRQAAEHMKQAARLDPENADYRLMLAEIHFASTYWNYGVRELQAAVAIRPGYAKARTRLGKAYLDRAIEEWQINRFRQARQELKRALSIDSRQVAASNLLALCNLDLGYPDSALALLRHLPEDSLDVDALLIAGMALFGKDSIEEASGAFEAALAQMDDTRRRRYLSRGFWTAGGATRETANLSETGRSRGDPGSAFLAYLWRGDDPDPGTAVNERLVEHLARVSFADFHFSVPRLGRPGSETTRGEVYCRYGRPRRWYYDPFGTNTFAGETVSPGDPSPFSGENPFANLAEIYRPTPLRLRKPRWVWLYEDFVLSFEDTHLNGDYTFPYEQDWSAYVDAYLRKNLPAVYQSEIRTRMRIALDAVSRLDDQGQPSVKMLLACDTRGIDYVPDVEMPSGEFELEIAFLDSAYKQIGHSQMRTQLRADSAEVRVTELPLTGTFETRPPAATALAAVSLRSLANGALGYAMAEVCPHRFTEGLEMSDIEVCSRPDRPGDPSRVFFGCTEIFLAFDVYNVSLNAAGSGEVELAYRLTSKAEPPALLTRLLRSLTGREAPEQTRQVSPVQGKERLTCNAARIHHVIPVAVTSLVEGEYTVEIRASDAFGADTAAVNLTLSGSSE